ncbi:histidinol-phosphate transaminase [uncultured Cocleimonas sp.]|uniref:histidinol-phosphate transaminase n=1 Tax=uncultured Cocleimonas sp. TaxID=1051587 RepID=UPI0026205E6B|nr:histidinol-phosphate transaminase [uncultured Cocleimonas sp.]
MSKFWSKRTHELSPYTAGEQPQDQQYIKLNTNENPYPPSPLAIEAMQAASGEAMRLYPDPNSFELKQAIADNFSVWTDQVFVGNSSDEVLAHAFVALLKHSKPLIFPDISYSFYPSYCKLFNIDHKQIPLADDFTIDLDDYSEETADQVGAIIFPNPNAPTGIALTLNEIEKILKANPDSPVVIDEAYVDFGARTAISLVNDYPNLLVTQTFSKSRSLAGLRVGFAIGSVEMIEALERVKNSFNAYPLDRAAIAGAAASIKDRAHFQENCSKIIKTRERVSAELSDLGFTVLPSKANFVFAKPEQDAEKLYLDLKANGVLVRYFNKPRINGFLRITIGTDEEMDLFIAKLKDLL